MPHKDAQKRRDYMNARNKAIREGLHIPGTIRDMRKGVDLVCENCKKPFYRSPANIDNGNNYCSRACMTEAYKGKFVGEKSPRWRGEETRPCNHCGKQITRPKWAWNKREKTFCDSSCFGAWKADNWTGSDNPCWRGGHAPYYGANWQRQSRECRRRDNHQCQFCGTSETQLRRALDVHHIRPFRFYAADDFKEANRLCNLISLCESCHKHLEAFCLSGEITQWSELLEAGRNHQARQTANPA